MAEFKMGDKVVLRGVVITVHPSRVLVESLGPRHWLGTEALEHDVSPAPVTVRCDKCGCEQPLTDFPTLQDRCKALGISGWSEVTLDEFAQLCAELGEKGVTAEQFVEGL